MDQKLDVNKGVYYKDYLQLDKIIHAQTLESEKQGIDAPDEMLFIVIHQAYELWFKQILFELELIQKIFSKNKIDNNSADLSNVALRLNRIVEIWKVLCEQINILETMTPLDFLDFRDLLRPASGFQSYQFKQLEAIMGLTFEQRHQNDFYLSHLKDAEKEIIKNTEQNTSISVLINDWLERMPFINENKYWENSFADFLSEYKKIYKSTLIFGEKENIEAFENTFEKETDAKTCRFSKNANRAMLFIMLYRDYPMMHLPFQILQKLLDIDELMAMWRHRHINMVHRMIGMRVGTGGSSGSGYLKGAMEKHYLFREIANISSFLIERKKLPTLSIALKSELSY